MFDDPTKIKVKIPNLNNGTYTVRWSMISADGHPSEGSYTFSIGEEVPTNAVVEGMRVPQFFRGYDCNPTLYCRGNDFNWSRSKVARYVCKTL